MITYLQLFGIGFAFSLSGPCLLFCSPAVILFLAAGKASRKRTFGELIIFLSGRLLAYLLLGILAGGCGSLLKAFISSALLRSFNLIAALVVIMLGVCVFFLDQRRLCLSPFKKIPACGRYGLFLLGFFIGISPCLPLITLLFEITIISRGALSGALYALSFGLGTFISSFLVMAGLAGLCTWLPARLLKSESSIFAFRAACAILIICFGIWLILKKV